jgi:hypothetical protein
VNNLAIVKPHLVSIYEELLRGIDDPQLRAAAKRVIADSRGRPKGWYERVRRWRRTVDPHQAEAIVEKTILITPVQVPGRRHTTAET